MFSSRNIIRTIKLRMMRGVGHVARVVLYAISGVIKGDSVALCIPLMLQGKVS
jgi:hypothetical protein